MADLHMLLTGRGSPISVFMIQFTFSILVIHSLSSRFSNPPQGPSGRAVWFRAIRLSGKHASRLIEPELSPWGDKRGLHYQQARQ
jgi:hypothetical protein